MKNGRNLLKKHTVWYDPFVEDYYIVIRRFFPYVYIKFIFDDAIIKVRIIECRDDEFVRKLSSLEIELL